MSEHNEALVRDYLGWPTRGDLDDTIDRVWADKIAYHGRELGELTTSDELKGMLRRFSGALPDMECSIKTLLSNDEYVLGVLETSGTVMSEGGTSSKISFSAIDMWRIKDGRLVEQWVIEGIADYRNPKRARVA
jgi:hypothetical protein